MHLLFIFDLSFRYIKKHKLYLMIDDFSEAHIYNIRDSFMIVSYIWYVWIFKSNFSGQLSFYFIVGEEVFKQYCLLQVSIIYEIVIQKIIIYQKFYI